MISPQENFPVTHLNTFHVEALSKYYIEFHNAESVSDFVHSKWKNAYPHFILGGGSNVLFTEDYPGTVIRPLIKGTEIVSETKDTVLIRVGAGEDWDSFVDDCVARNLGGIENLSYIPGSVGASPVQNIGAYGVEVADAIHSVEGIHLDSGNNFLLQPKECRFSYRDSVFKHELKNNAVITYVTFCLQKEHRINTAYPDLNKELNNYEETTIQNIRKAIIAIRRKKLPDPEVIGNAGSFFKNPLVSKEQVDMLRKSINKIPVYEGPDNQYKLSAAWLIEQSGWKGRRWGRTGTYKKQPLILVNHGNASGKEIYECALRIQKAVRNRFAIKLEMEVNVL